MSFKVSQSNKGWGDAEAKETNAEKNKRFTVRSSTPATYVLKIFEQKTFEQKTFEQKAFEQKSFEQCAAGSGGAATTRSS
jgi:hypothetical protein